MVSPGPKISDSAKLKVSPRQLACQTDRQTSSLVFTTGDTNVPDVCHVTRVCTVISDYPYHDVFLNEYFLFV